MIASLLVATLLVFLQWRSGVELSLFTVAVMAALAYATLALGRLLATPAGVRDGDPSTAWVLGLIAASLAGYGLTALLPLTAGAALGILAAVVIVLDLVFRKKHPPTERKALIGFALAVALTAAWCSEPAGAYQVLRTQDVLPVWGDYFIHGAYVSQFGDPRALGRGSILLADLPSTFYHFASYLPAAALATLLDQPGLALATSAWMPLGFLAMTAGAYALGERLAGAAGGIAAMAAVAMLPDASNYGLRNGFLSFHWSVLAHPGATYALGAAFVSLALLDRWSRERSRAALAASAALAAAIVLFRAHVFLLFLPAWAATAAYCAMQESRHRRRVAAWLFVALAAGAAAANVVLTQLGEGQWRFGGSALGWFLTVAHSGHEPTAYTDFYAEVMIGDEWGYSLVVGIVLSYLAALGTLAALLPAAALLARRWQALRPLDAFPAYVAYSWLLLLLFAPLTWAVQGPELIDRPVVLLYAAIAIWAACLLLRSSARAWPVALAAAIVLLPVMLAHSAQLARPKFASGALHLDLRAEPGLLELAAFLRREARAGDSFAVAGLSAEFAVVDLALELCALTGVPAYVSRPHLEMLQGGPRKDAVAARVSALREVALQGDAAQAHARLRQMRVQWYVVPHGAAPRWDPARERAVFHAGKFSLYAAR